MVYPGEKDIHQPKESVGIDVSERAGVREICTGTAQDGLDMQRIGKVQEFKRDFNQWSILGLTSILMCTWEALISTSTFSLINGGLAGTMWIYLGCWICTLSVSLSLAELASMAPTSGGQYHWVSEFAPPSIQRFVSYIIGWLSALGWQAAIATTAYASAIITLELVTLNNPTYESTQWQGTLMTIAVGVIATLFNTYGSRYLPLVEKFILFLHIAGFFAICIPLWIIAPKVSAHEAFTSFSNFGGWPNVATAVVIGQLSATGSLGGSDGAVHMAEEVHNAGYILPRMIIATVLINGIMGFVAILTLVLCVTDIDSMIIGTTFTYPFIQIFAAATGSVAGGTVMSVIILLLTFSCCLSTFAAASRQVWAFARDKGLPCSVWFRKIDIVGTQIPLNAVLSCLTMTIILSLLNLGSTAAFNSIVGLLAGSGGFSFAISIGCLLVKRLRGQALPPSQFSLGKAGVFINGLATCYTLFYAVVSFFPLFAHVTVETMNWGSVMFSGAVSIAILLYALQGRKTYEGPVVHVAAY